MTTKLLRNTNSKYIDIIAFLLTGIFILAGILVSIYRYWQYETFYYDFGIFDQAIWLVSRFQPPIIDHFVIGNKLIFADHFSPSIFLLAPLYWITDRRETLLLMQSIVVGLSGFVLYVVGKNLLKNRFLSITILICYFLFTGLQMAVISDFHELTIMTLPLMLTFWAILQKKIKMYFFFLAMTLGFKEVTFLLGIGIGIFILLIQKKLFKIGIATIIISVLWGIISIKFIIPFFLGGSYIYSPELHETLPKNIAAFFDHQLKRRTLFYSFLSFGFLPIFSIEFWSLLIQDYGVRFLPKHCCSRWDLGLHYNAQSAVLLAMAALYTMKKIQVIPRLNRYLPFLSVLLVINAFVLYRFVLHGPFALAYNPTFYQQTENLSYLNYFIAKVPKDASVMTQNNLALRFTHQTVRILRKNYRDFKPDYIVLDLRKGQNENNFFGTEDIFKIYDTLMNDQQYSILYQSKEQFIFKRKKI